MPDSTPIVLVVYKRDTKTSETFSGSIDGSLGVSPTHWTFHGLTFNEILEQTGHVLRNSPSHRLVMKREEAPQAVEIPPEITELLRTDFHRALETFTVPPQTVVVRPPCKGIAANIRFGTNTLADSLGDEVYLRMRVQRDSSWVEDPATGRWASLGVDKLCGSLPLVYVSPYRGAWYTARTADVLSLGLPRYYLPRAWNPGRGWIDHESLASMYEAYKKEKEDAERQ